MSDETASCKSVSEERRRIETSATVTGLILVQVGFLDDEGALSVELTLEESDALLKALQRTIDLVKERKRNQDGY